MKLAAARDGTATLCDVCGRAKTSSSCIHVNRKFARGGGQVASRFFFHDVPRSEVGAIAISLSSSAYNSDSESDEGGEFEDEDLIQNSSEENEDKVKNGEEEKGGAILRTNAMVQWFGRQREQVDRGIASVEPAAGEALSQAMLEADMSVQTLAFHLDELARVTLETVPVPSIPVQEAEIDGKLQILEAGLKRPCFDTIKNELAELDSELHRLRSVTKLAGETLAERQLANEEMKALEEATLKATREQEELRITHERAKKEHQASQDRLNNVKTQNAKRQAQFDKQNQAVKKQEEELAAARASLLAARTKLDQAMRKYSKTEIAFIDKKKRADEELARNTAIKKAEKLAEEEKRAAAAALEAERLARERAAAAAAAAAKKKEEEEAQAQLLLLRQKQMSRPAMYCVFCEAHKQDVGVLLPCRHHICTNCYEEGKSLAQLYDLPFIHPNCLVCETVIERIEFGSFVFNAALGEEEARRA